MRCLVTGASGFLGSHLVRLLLKRNHEVVALLRPQTDAWRIADCIQKIEVVKGSLDDLEVLHQTLISNPVDVAFHLAWAGVTGDQRNNTSQSIKNLTSTLHLWEILRDTECKHLIGAGSQAEYGPHTVAITEDASTNPQTSYGASKLALGLMLKQFCAGVGMGFSWVRIFSVYGPADDDKHLVPSLISSMLKGTRPALTMGEQVWDYLYVEDAVRALTLIAENRADGVYNLGSGRAITLREFISTVRDAINPELELGFGDVPYRPDQVMHLLANIRTLSSKVNWIPQIEIDQGIAMCIEWQEKQVRV